MCLAELGFDNEFVSQLYVMPLSMIINQVDERVPGTTFLHAIREDWLAENPLTIEGKAGR